MITDDIDRWKTYRFSEAFSKAFHFLEGVHADCPDGEYEIDGRKLYAIVMSYDTENAPVEKLEIHRKYIDIQYAVSGVETLVYTPYDDLDILTPYNDEKDFEFLKAPANRELARLEMQPGNFAVFFPQDAHFGKIASAVSGPQRIRKVVVKAALSVL